MYLSTDPQFPPDASSLYRDVNNKKYPHLEDYIWKWKRVSDFFNETAYVALSFYSVHMTDLLNN